MIRKPVYGYGLCKCGCGQKTKRSPTKNTLRGYKRGEPYRYIHGHHVRRTDPEYEIRDCGYYTPCWVWQHDISKGYGRLPAGVAKARGTSRGAHKAYYQTHIGPIPEGMVIDHLCRNTLCVNPGHLDATSVAENTRRGLNTKLADHEVEDIRNLYAQGGIFQRQLAAIYGVTQSQISVIVNHKSRRNSI